jgi:hypothetical protein
MCIPLWFTHRSVGLCIGADYSPATGMRTRLTVRCTPLNLLRIAHQASFQRMCLHSCPSRRSSLSGTNNWKNAESGSENAGPQKQDKPASDRITCPAVVAGTSVLQNVEAGCVTQSDVALRRDTHRRGLHPVSRVLNQPALPLRPP